MTNRPPVYLTVMKEKTVRTEQKEIVVIAPRHSLRVIRSRVGEEGTVVTVEDLRGNAFEILNRELCALPKKVRLTRDHSPFGIHDTFVIDPATSDGETVVASGRLNEPIKLPWNSLAEHCDRDPVEESVAV